MDQNSVVNTAKMPKNNNDAKKKYKQKIAEIFSLKMFRYSIIKILKAPSTWIIIVISFIIGLALVGAIGITLNPWPPETYAQAAQKQIIIYLFIWYILYFGMFSMFIGFKSVQLIRDEIDDGTLLIFASIPISRTRMVIEKWISLQIICLLYGVIVLIIPPILILMTGEGGAIFGKLVLTKVNFMIVTSFIVQLLLTTIGVLVSLGLNSKGVVGILATVGICSIVGGIGPMIFNATHIDSNKAKYILSTTSLARDSYKIDWNKNGETYDKLIDPSGWPIWNVSSETTKDLTIQPREVPFSFNVDTFVAEANALITAGSTNMDRLLNAVNIEPNVYPTYAKLIKDREIQFDGLTSFSFKTVMNWEGTPEYDFVGNMDKGFNALGKFYNDILTQKPEKATLQKTPLTKNEIFSLDKIDRTKLPIDSQKVYDVIVNLYSTKILTPQIYQSSFRFGYFQLPSYFSSSNIARSIANKIDKNNFDMYVRFWDDMQKLIDSAYFSSNILYLNAPILSMVTQVANVFNGIASSISFGQESGQTGVYADQSKAQVFLDNVNAIATKLKVMGYLNIFQQWVTMWTGDVYVPTNNELIDIGTLVLPINHYTKVKLNTFTYQNSAVPGAPALTAYVVGIDSSQGVTIVSLGGLYAGYIIISFGLAALTLWWVSRKDFV